MELNSIFCKIMFKTFQLGDIDFRNCVDTFFFVILNFGINDKLRLIFENK